MRSGEEIQADLRRFVMRWRDYAEGERQEAQTFLNELIACYGADRKAVGARFEKARTATGIMDMYWRDRCIVEMKAPRLASKLAEHRTQALDYWRTSSDVASDRPAPPYVVLCAFQRFEIWEPGRFPSAPRADFTLDELPENYEKLLFLAGTDEEPLFGVSYKELTTEAATVIADLYRMLVEREAAAPATLRSFVMQVVWCLFAEDLGMLDGHPVQRIVNDLIHHPERTSWADLGGLFEILNDREDYGRRGILRGTCFVNGSLFETPARVHLEPGELAMLKKAAEFDWRKVDPTIFGSLMEGCLGDRRWELAAHYTHEADIMKIVRPTIIEPWRERINATTTVAEVRQVLDELCAFRVLDPACGCGNFLYVAYRELRAFEHELKERLVTVAQKTGMPTPDLDGLPFYPLKNLRGLDIEPTAVLIARVTLWMGQRQMIDRFGAAEPVLPLVDLSGIEIADALERPWPETDCIIGNPPFLGSQHIRGVHGDEYTERLKKTFQVGVKDYCVYFYRKAQDHLGAGQRAGLVGTNSISQNRARGVSLDYIVETGGVITDAVSTQKWPGEAHVHVSIVNWVKDPPSPPTTFVLDGEKVDGITPELRTPEHSTGDAARLSANKARCFQGPIPAGEGFIITGEEAQALLARSDADYRRVVRPYLGSADIARRVRQDPSRWAIDFGVMSLEVAMRYPAALAIVRERVKPEREKNNRELYRRNWWQFAEPRPGLRRAVANLRRCVVMGAHGKRLLFSWQDTWTMGSNATMVFAFEDDYAMGVLSSRTHEVWAMSRSSTIKGDPRYTNTSCFETFPWPYPVTDDQRKRVAEASRAVITRRHGICVEANIGLTALYNAVDEGAYTDLRAMHDELNEAVAAAYGWPASISHDGDEIVHRLLELNREIAAGTRPYDPFGAQAWAAHELLLRREGNRHRNRGDLPVPAPAIKYPFPADRS
ncbi:MAG: DNA methyltransferase [Acidimicrobiales bacterium]